MYVMDALITLCARITLCTIKHTHNHAVKIERPRHLEGMHVMGMHIIRGKCLSLRLAWRQL